MCPLPVDRCRHLVEAETADALHVPRLRQDLHRIDRHAADEPAPPRRQAPKNGLAYAQALADGVSLRKAAKRCGIVLDTAFRWRHRFLQLPKHVKAASVSGIVEVDETYFLKSQKGARKVLGRKPRKRGGKASKPGLSDEHTPVLIARDRSGATTDAMLDKVDAAHITAHLAPVVDKDSLLISDGRKAYWSVPANMTHVQSLRTLIPVLSGATDRAGRSWQQRNSLSNSTLMSGRDWTP